MPFQQGDLLCNGFGQCSIVLSQTSSRMQGGEIYFLSFYKNSFSYKTSANSLTRYYLFNTKPLEVGQDSAYDHLFFCRSFNVSYSDQRINGRNFSMQGLNLKFKLIKQVLSSGYVQTALFQTKAINLNMKVVNTLNTFCTASPPIATVNMENVYQTNFTVDNLELRQCNEGVLKADIELIRGTMDQFGVFTHVRSEWHKNIKIGDIGCDPTCQFCTGISFRDCFVCVSNLPFLAGGQCYPTCPNYAPYYMTQQVVYQKKLWPAPQCIANCPLGYYPDSVTNECLACNLDCQTCNRSEIKSCQTCQPVKYLFDGLCVSECPAPHFVNNFSTYTCNQVSSTKYLQVSIQSLGYKLKIPKDQQTYLRAIITNDGGGQIISILWEQLEPTPPPPGASQDSLVFTVDSDGTIENTAPAVRLKMTALNYIAATQVVKVKCTVTNSLGEIAYDIYEFFQNAPPDYVSYGGSTTLTLFGDQGNGNGTAGDTIYLMNLTNWYDSDYINFRAFMIINQVYYTLTDNMQQVLPNSSPTLFYFKIPLASTTAVNSSIQICVLATDFAFATAQYCMKAPILKNNLTYAKNLTALSNQLISLKYEGNITNAIYASQMMYQAMKSPQRPPSQPSICTQDFHCNNQGSCESFLGNQRCVCDQTYSGTFCQFVGSQLNDFKNITTQIITALYDDVTSQVEITSNEIELIAVMLRGILKDPDIVDVSMFESVILMLEMVGSASIYAHYPVTIDVRNMYMDTLSGVMNKLFHSYKVQRAFPNVVELQQEKSLLMQAEFQANSSSLRRNLQGSSSGKSSNSSTTTTGPIVNSTNELIKGVNERMAMLSSQSMQGSVYQRWGRRLDLQITTFIDRFLPKLNPIYPTYSYSSNVFYLQVENGLAPNFKGISLWVEEKDVTWYLPQSIFDNAQGRASDRHEVNLVVMKYLASPFFFERNPGAFVETNVTALTIYDSGGYHVNVTITNANDYVMIMEPYNKTQAYETELIRCMSWDETNNAFLNDGSCAYSEIYSIVPCITCDQGVTLNVTVSLCRCKHLSRFAGVYTQTQPQLGSGPLVGLYVNFQSMSYWSQSFGFFITLGASGFYLVGIAIFYIIDQYTIPHVLKRIIARVKRLELKGFKQKAEKNLHVYRDEKGKIVFIRLNQKKEGEDGEKKGKVDEDAVIQLKQSGLLDEDKQKKRGDETNVAEAFLTPAKTKKGNLGDSTTQKLMNSTKQKKEDDEAEQIDGEEAKSDGQSVKKKKPEREYDEYGGYVNEYGEYVNADEAAMEEDIEVEDEEEEEEDPEVIAERKRAENDLIEQEMIKKLKEEQEVMEFVKEHGTNSDEEDKSELSRSKDQKLYLKLEKKSKERYWFDLKSLVIHGNVLLNLLMIDSMLMPRHVRFTMFFTNLLLNFFWCAVIFKSSQQGLLLPDVGSKGPGQVATGQLWISMAAPFGTTIVMYVFAGLFKISEQRLVHSYTMAYLEKMLVELKKEMKMRFIIAYTITLAIYAAIFWYIISFTAAFGWHLSWVWWYSGCFAIIIQYFGVDVGVAFLQWILHWCSRSLSLFFMSIREVKMCRQEA